MTDTHSHIYLPEFDRDRDAVVSNATKAGVTKILLPNINSETISPMLALCLEYPGYCFPMIGLHPEDVKADWQQKLDDMHSLLEQTDMPYVAVGEVGLDFYWDDTHKREQMDAFAQQVEWAIGLDLPLAIHSRSAHKELVEIMKTYSAKAPRGIFHCFCGTLKEAKELLRFDSFVLGIGGALTYKKSSLPEVIRALPMKRMVVETDSPYLAPVPHRGKRNESAFIVHTFQKIALEKGLKLDEVVRMTDETVDIMFPKTSAQCNH